jgi:hypothetical protein
MRRLALTLLFLSATAWGRDWRQPVGIPAPPFGVSEDAPARPNPWSKAVAGWYYIADGNCTDDNNANGYPGHPRCTIPSPLAAGSVVEIHGTINTRQFVVAQGTPARPVWVRGEDYASRPKFTQGVGIAGSYVIVENLYSGPAGPDATGFGMGVPEGNDHIVIRDSELSGNLNRGGGIGLGSWSYKGTEWVDNVVIDHVLIHDLGNLASDDDSHCITLNGSVRNVWVTNSTLHHCSGDAIQMEAQRNRADKIHNIYYGRNVAYNNRQTGGWVKHATDVIFSQNVVHDIRNNPTGYLGTCLGAQYDHGNIWFLFNTLYNCDQGIRRGSGDTGAGAGPVYIIGNLLYHIHAPARVVNRKWDAGAIINTNDARTYVVGNTIYDVDAGVNVPHGTVDVIDNIIAGRSNALNHELWYEQTPAAAVISHNRFYVRSGAYRFAWGATDFTSLGAFRGASAKCQKGCSTGDPAFVSADRDFHLQSRSAAIGAGIESEVYAAFQARYGIDIRRDIEGVRRGPNRAWDIGAYQSAAPAKASAPGPAQK